MADYWLKLYMEILDDPKMATLPDRLWRRAIELFLIAKRINKEGELPDTAGIAWMLRLDSDDLDLDLKQLATTGIINKTITGWFVVNFKKRQASATSTERVKEFRQREHRNQYYDTEAETHLKRNVSQSRADTEQSRADTEAEGAPASASPIIPQNPAGAIMPMICRVTGMASIPPKEVQRIEQFHRMIEQYGLTRAEAELSIAYKKWINTPRKNGGGKYSPSNFGWVDWAQDALISDQVEVSYDDLKTNEEKLVWLKKLEQKQQSSGL